MVSPGVAFSTALWISQGKNFVQGSGFAAFGVVYRVAASVGAAPARARERAPQQGQTEEWRSQSLISDAPWLSSIRMASEPKSDASHWREIAEPRIAPARGAELNPLLRPIAALAGRVIGGPPPNLFVTLARHGRLFVPWLLFASRLMPRGTMRRVDTELVILRVAHNARCRYEWDHHLRIGAKAGLTEEQIDRVAAGPEAAGWSGREAALLRATDELHADRFVSDETWARLSEFLSHKELIELCMLVGHYEMLAGTIASTGIQPERPL